MKIDLSDVQETLLLPLWSRAQLSKEYGDVLMDNKAVDIVENLDFDFTQLKNNLPYFIQLSHFVRAREFDKAIISFCKRNPKALIVNLGAGLDTTSFRVDNGQIEWINMDLPDVIEIRKKLIPDTERFQSIAGSIFDNNWHRLIENKDNGIFFICGGVLKYFDEDIVQGFFQSLANNFPGCEIVFDTMSTRAIHFANSTLKKTGMKSAEMKWGIDDAKEMENWNNQLCLVDQFSIFEKVEINKKWTDEIIDNIEKSNRTKGSNIAHIKVLN